MKFCKFIVAQEIQKKGKTGDKTIFSTFMEDSCVFELGEACPIIKPGKGCIGMGVPFEIHINQSGTIIFYTEVTGGAAKDRDFLEAMYELWLVSVGDADMSRPAFRTDADTSRTGVDAATRMMMGSARSASEIARGGRPSPNRDTLYNALRGSPFGPGDDEDWD